MALPQGDLGLPELVMASTPRAAKVAALRTRPSVAVTIDGKGFPPDVLLLRRRAEVTDVDGIVREYAQAASRDLGEDAVTGFLAQFDAATRMHRIAVRPRLQDT